MKNSYPALAHAQRLHWSSGWPVIHAGGLLTSGFFGRKTLTETSPVSLLTKVSVNTTASSGRFPARYNSKIPKSPSKPEPSVRFFIFSFSPNIIFQSASCSFSRNGFHFFQTQLANFFCHGCHPSRLSPSGVNIRRPPSLLNNTLRCCPIASNTALSPSEDLNTFRSLPGWVCEDQRHPWRANSRPISGVTGTEV